ncbi:hypothetical protein BD626DRAFT_573594 [Schizophyllum amplum]|uniref:Uncharacterized protein n=1 Tax=Schizophyllum amplum TaxID=97359 RepID=A0A550C0R0_9AGAR|nr:hypothetical protein BD626DRAFT_573594 [Auriculariopsis ampla]
MRHPQFRFQYLDVDPFTLNELHWGLCTPEVKNAVRDLEVIGHFLRLTVDQGAPLRQLLATHVFHLWHRIVSWLDYLHPMHHFGTERMTHVPMSVLASALYGLFLLKPTLPDLFNEAPQIYRALFDLWIHIDVYCEFPLALLHIKHLHLLFLTVESALLRHDILAKLNASRRLDPEDVDMVARDMALSAVGHQPRRLYHRFVRIIDLFIRPMDPYAIICMDSELTLIDVAMGQLSFLATLSNIYLPVSSQRKDVIQALVRMIRFLLDRPGDALEAAEEASMVLWGMWKCAGDHRSLVWSLRDGVLDLIGTVHNKRPSNTMKSMLKWIANQAMYVKVLRALSPGGRVVPFGNPVVDTSMRAPSQIVHVLMSDFSSVLVDAHRTAMGSVDAPSGLAVASFPMSIHPHDYGRSVPISPLDVRFHILYARSLVRKNFAELNLVEIPRSEGWQLCNYCLSIDLRQMPPQLSLRVMPRRPRGTHSEEFQGKFESARMSSDDPHDHSEVRYIVTALVPALSRNAKPYGVKALDAPLSLMLDVYMPVGDGWIGPGGDWKSDCEEESVK